ncbi:MAG: peptidoglycan glycosyltransferase [Bacteroidetes bacterium]|jgi:penicillin-binding protein 1A|nr:peptidoglycan glycosyltransferase [Bacteroidota bacterium]
MAQRKEKSKIPGPTRSQRFDSWVKKIWIFFGVGLVGLTLFLYLFSFSDLPGFEELENPDIDYATEVYDQFGRDLGRYYVQNRVAVPYDSLNPYLIKALISTEDARYFEHSGIDARSLLRVLFKTIILQQGSSGGGSTITQQLAKQLYSQRDFSGLGKVGKAFRLIYYKLKEWYTAVRLERRYTKEEILAMYINEYDFIYGAYGVDAAARTYFGKEQGELSVEESATLVGMLKNSVLYNPVKFPENCVNRRNVVLAQMEKKRYITESEKDSLQTLAIDLSNFERSSHISGRATYFRASLAEWLKDLIRDRELKKANGQLYNIYRDGLKVYTTVNLDYQKLLEEAVQSHMAKLQVKFFNHWSGKDIWSYRYDKIATDLKQSALESQIQGTERYRSLFARQFTAYAIRIKEDFGFDLRDYDIERMMKSEKDANYLNRILAQGYIAESKLDAYQNLMSSDLWIIMKSDWEAFQEELDRQFSEKRAMTVFAYNERGEKDTVMSPLDSLKYHRMILQVGSVAMDPSSGAVRAWVGGTNHKYFKYDHVLSDRQVGSTFKPFVYATAIAYQGFSPCFPVTDVQYTIKPGEGNFNLLDPWSPKNATDEYTRGPLTLYEALKQSKNTVTVYLLKQLGDVKPILGLINNMGIDSSATLPNGRKKIPRQPSIGLGAADLNVLEMTGAYGTFANQGTYNTPFFVARIEDRNGKVIYQNVSNSNVAINSDVNYVMVELLRKAGYMAKIKGSLKSDVGGKTGTTQNQTDAWFMGISPNLVLGTWVGGEDRWIRFRRIGLGQGSTMARPIFTDFFRRLEDRENQLVNFDSKASFQRPEELNIETVCDQYGTPEKESDKPKRNIPIFGQ